MSTQIQRKPKEPKIAVPSCYEEHTHARDPHNLYKCIHCGKAIYFGCTRCGEVTIKHEEHTRYKTSYLKHALPIEEIYYVPHERCPKCNRLMWEVCSWNDTDGTQNYSKGQLMPNAHYRALVKASGVKSGKKIVIGHPVSGTGPQMNVTVKLAGLNETMSWEEFAKTEIAKQLGVKE